MKDVMPDIRDDRLSVSPDRKRRRLAELAGPFAGAAEFPDKRPVRADDDDSLAQAIEDVEIARTVEPHAGDVPELLPVPAVQRSHPVELLEAEVQPAVVAGQVDGFLGAG